MVVMPVVAIFMPQVMVVDNQMSTSPEHRRQNTAAVRAITAFVVLTFVFAGLITGTDPGACGSGWPWPAWCCSS